MHVHLLKTNSTSLCAHRAGGKNFSIRKNDRNFYIGDVVCLTENCPTSRGSKYTIIALITYITDWQQAPEYVVLGLHPIASLERDYRGDIVEVEPVTAKPRVLIPYESISQFTDLREGMA